MARKTGEKPKSRQPFTIDLLPVEIHERIKTERKEGRSWAEIERRSPTWTEWEKADPKAAAAFPGKRIPHSNLQRWNDVRIEQEMADAERDAEAARQIATVLAGKKFEDLPEALRSAQGELAFRLLRAGGDAKELLKVLGDFSVALSQMDRVEVQKQKLEIEREKVEIAKENLEIVKSKVKSLRKDSEKKKLTPAELQQRLDEIYGITDAKS